MENNNCEALIINDNYYQDLETYVNCEFGSIEEIEATNDEDYPIVAFTCETKPLQVFTPDWIAKRISDDKFSEDGIDREYELIIEALKKCIDFEKLNSMMPKMNYGTKNSINLSKQDLINSF